MKKQMKDNSLQLVPRELNANQHNSTIKHMTRILYIFVHIFECNGAFLESRLLYFGMIAVSTFFAPCVSNTQSTMTSTRCFRTHYRVSFFILNGEFEIYHNHGASLPDQNVLKLSETWQKFFLNSPKYFHKVSSYFDTS